MRITGKMEITPVGQAIIDKALQSMPDEYVVGGGDIPEWLREYARGFTANPQYMTLDLGSPYDNRAQSWTAETGDIVTKIEHGLKITRPNGDFTEMRFNPHSPERYHV